VKAFTKSVQVYAFVGCLATPSYGCWIFTVRLP